MQWPPFGVSGGDGDIAAVGDPQFRHELAELLLLLTKSISPNLEHSDFVFEFDHPMPSQSSKRDTGNALSDVIYDGLRRYPKTRAMVILKTVAPKIDFGERNSTLREMIIRFLESATTEQTQRLLKAIGVSVSEDPFLAGLSSRVGKP